MVTENLGELPRPITEISTQYIKFSLRNRPITGDGRFSPSGIFATKRDHQKTYWWGSNVFRFNPHVHKLEANDSGFLRVYRDDRRRRSAFIVHPGNIRQVKDIGSGRVIVPKDGILLPPGGYSLFANGKYFTQDELREEIAKGTKSSLSGRAHGFFKVSGEEYEGEEFSLISFEHILSQEQVLTPIKPDAVVVDPRARVLIEREVIYPFLSEEEYNAIFYN